MTRIYTLGLLKEEKEGGSYLLMQVAHKHSKGAIRVALDHAAKEGGRWRIAHRTERRTSLTIPMGEVLGTSGPFTYSDVDE